MKTPANPGSFVIQSNVVQRLYKIFRKYDELCATFMPSDHDVFIHLDRPEKSLPVFVCRAPVFFMYLRPYRTTEEVLKGFVLRITHAKRPLTLINFSAALDEQLRDFITATSQTPLEASEKAPEAFAARTDPLGAPRFALSSKAIMNLKAGFAKAGLIKVEFVVHNNLVLAQFERDSITEREQICWAGEFFLMPRSNEDARRALQKLTLPASALKRSGDFADALAQAIELRLLQSSDQALSDVFTPTKELSVPTPPLSENITLTMLAGSDRPEPLSIKAEDGTILELDPTVPLTVAPALARAKHEINQRMDALVDFVKEATKPTSSTLPTPKLRLHPSAKALLNTFRAQGNNLTLTFTIGMPNLVQVHVSTDDNDFNEVLGAGHEVFLMPSSFNGNWSVFSDVCCVIPNRVKNVAKEVTYCLRDWFEGTHARASEGTKEATQRAHSPEVPALRALEKQLADLAMMPLSAEHVRSLYCIVERAAASALQRIEQDQRIEQEPRTQSSGSFTASQLALHPLPLTLSEESKKELDNLQQYWSAQADGADKALYFACRAGNVVVGMGSALGGHPPAMLMWPLPDLDKMFVNAPPRWLAEKMMDNAKVNITRNQRWSEAVQVYLTRRAPA